MGAVLIKFRHEEVDRLLGQARRALSPAGLRSVAGQIAEDLRQFSEQAFSAKKDPSTGAAWPAPAPRTLRDVAFRELLRRSGALQRGLTTRIEAAEGGATAALVLPESGPAIAKALALYYGARKKRKKGPYRVPSRPFAGYPLGALSRWAQLILKEALGD